MVRSFACASQALILMWGRKGGKNLSINALNISFDNPLS